MPAAAISNTAVAAMMLVCWLTLPLKQTVISNVEAQLKFSTFSFSLALSYCLFARYRSRLICMECDIFHADRK